MAAAALAAVVGIVVWAGVGLHQRRDPPLIAAFMRGRLSPELFTLPNGVNEFDLLKIDGVYYFAQDDKTDTLLRSAPSLKGLNAAPVAVIPGGRYPTIQFFGGKWHVWAWVQANNATEHYVADAFAGPYALADEMLKGRADIHVRRGPDGRFYAVYKDMRKGASLAVGMLVADAPSGPWTDLGHILPSRAPWFSAEEADPAMFVSQGKMFLTFAGWNGVDRHNAQIPGIVRLSTSTKRAVGTPRQLVTAKAPWQMRNGNAKLFNPVFLCDDNRARIFYAQNVSTAGVAAGWGFITALNKEGLPKHCAG